MAVDAAAAGSSEGGAGQQSRFGAGQQSSFDVHAGAGASHVDVGGSVADALRRERLQRPLSPAATPSLHAGGAASTDEGGSMFEGDAARLNVLPGKRHCTKPPAAGARSATSLVPTQLAK